MPSSKKGVIIILGFFLVLFLLVPVLRPATQAGGKPASVSEDDYKELTHKAAVDAIKTYLFDQGITKLDRLGWYYPESYMVKDGVHYSTSKLDFFDADHSYTVGVTFDAQNIATPVFMMLDGDTLLKPAPTADESFALNAARASVTAAASNPKTVLFDKDSTGIEKEGEYLRIFERFDFVNASGIPDTKEYYALVSVEFGKAQTVLLSIGDSVIFDRRAS